MRATWTPPLPPLLAAAAVPLLGKLERGPAAAVLTAMAVQDIVATFRLRDGRTYTLRLSLTG